MPFSRLLVRPRIGLHRLDGTPLGLGVERKPEWRKKKITFVPSATTFSWHGHGKDSRGWRKQANAILATAAEDLLPNGMGWEGTGMTRHGIEDDAFLILRAKLGQAQGPHVQFLCDMCFDLNPCACSEWRRG